MKYLNNLCTSIGLTLIYIFVIRILDFHPSDLPFLLLHFIARFIIARSEIRRSLVSALNRNTTTKMTSYFCEIDLSYACTPHGNGCYGILPQCLILVRPLKLTGMEFGEARFSAAGDRERPTSCRFDGYL